MKKTPLALTFATLLAASTLSAATFTWDPSATPGIQDGAGAWDTATANWTTDAGATDVAYGNALTDAVIIGSGGAGGTITVGTVNANALTFGTTITSGYTLSGGTITLSGTTPTITNNNTAFATTISSGIAGSAGVTLSGSGITNFNGNKTYTGGTIINAGTLRLASGGGPSGIITGTATVNSGATLDFAVQDASGYNTSGQLSTINLNGGTLNVSTTSNQTLGNGVINLTGGNITGVAGSKMDFYRGSSALNTLASGTTSTISGVSLAIRQTGGLTINVADGAASTDLQINSVIATSTGESNAYTAAPLIKSGAGTLALTAANTYSGATTINGGVLTLSGSGTIASTGSVAINNGSTLRLDNTTNNTNRVNDGAAITMNGGGIDFVTNATGSSSETFGALTVASGANTVTISQADVGQTSKITFASLSRTAGSINFVGAGLGSAVNTRSEIAFTSAPTLTNGIIGAWATVNGTDLATLSGNSIVAYSGYTDITARGSSTIADGATTNVRIFGDGTSGNIALGATTTTVNSLLMSSNPTVAATVDTASKTLATGGVTVATGAQSLTIGASVGSGTLTAATAGGVLVLNNFSSNALTINSVIADNTSASSTVFGGTGTTILTAGNTYTGGSTIGAGATVQIGAGALGSGASTTAALSATGTVTIASGGKLIYNRAGTTAYANSSLSGAGAVEFYGRNNGTTGGTLDNVALNNSSTGFSGTMLISGIRAVVDNIGDLGSATVTVNSTGQIQFSATTFTNNFIISGEGWGESVGRIGVFRLAGTTLSGSITLAGDSVIGTHGSTGTISGVIGETGGARKLIIGGGSTSSTTLTLNGANTYTGGTDLGKGTLTAAITAKVGNNAAFGTGTVTVRDSATVDTSGGARTVANNFAINSGKTLTLAGSAGQLTLNGAIADVAGAGALTVSSGTVKLAGTNTYTGITTVTGGSLIFGNKASFYNNTPASWTTTNLVVNSGATAAFGVGGAGEFTSADIDTLATLSTATGGFKSGSSIGFDTTNATGGFTYASVIANNGANTLGVAKFGVNTLTLSNNNTYTGATTVYGGTLQVGGTIANTASISINNAGLTVLNGGSMTTAGALATTGGSSTITVNSGGSLSAGSFNQDYGASNVIDGSMAVSGTWKVATASSNTVSGSGTITANAIDMGNSNTALTYSGSGSLTVAGKLTTSVTTNGANTFTQSSGTVNLGGIQLGTLAKSTTTTQTFNLNGGRMNIGASGITSEGTGSRVINLGAGTVGAQANWSSSLDMALTVATGNGTTFNTLDSVDGVTARTIALSGILSGAGALTKSGTGTLALTGLNAYTGGTTITGGTLVTGNDKALGGGSVALAGGTLQIGNGAVQTVTLDSAKNITATAAATLAFNGADSKITLSGGGKYDFSGQTITLDLNNAFNTDGSYILISGGTGNVDATSYSFTNVGAGTYSFIDGVLNVSAVPEPSTYGLLGAGSLATVALVRRRRKSAR